MIIKNASIYTEDHTFVNGNAVVENGRFVSFPDFSEQVLRSWIFPRDFI